MNVTLAQIAKAVEGLIAPFEKLAAYFALGGVGVADYPHLPVLVRSVLAGAGAYHIVQGNKTAKTA
jgi:hypothetical protein